VKKHKLSIIIESLINLKMNLFYKRKQQKRLFFMVI